MDLFDGVPRALGIAAASVGAALGALAVARVLRLDRLFTTAGRAPMPSLEAEVRDLSSLADLALCQGMLGLESHVAACGDDFLIRAVSLAVEGAHPDEIRSRMDADIDAGGVGAPKPVSRLILRLAHVPQFVPMLSAAGLVVIMATAGSEPASIAPAAAAGFTLFAAGLISGAVIGPLADRIASRQAALIMLRMLQVEAVASIRSGCDGHAVEARLRALLPSSHAATPLARAA